MTTKMTEVGECNFTLKVRILVTREPFFRKGDYAMLDPDSGWADFNNLHNQQVYGDGIWTIATTPYEPVPDGPDSLRLTYSVVNHGDDTAGIPYFSDTVTVEVESGDPGGEEGKFAEFILTALIEWYDGARVTKEG